jgi:hypothetical protein
MENLILTSTDETPEINFNTNGQLLLKGISVPENVSNFYLPLIAWIQELEKTQPREVTLVFEIEYINTASTRVFIDLVKKVMSLKNDKCSSKIVWRHEEEDEDNLDLGKDLEYSAKTTFEFQVI